MAQRRNDISEAGEDETESIQTISIIGLPGVGDDLERVWVETQTYLIVFTGPKKKKVLFHRGKSSAE